MNLYTKYNLVEALNEFRLSAAAIARDAGHESIADEIMLMKMPADLLPKPDVRLSFSKQLAEQKLKPYLDLEISGIVL